MNRTKKGMLCRSCLSVEAEFGTGADFRRGLCVQCYDAYDLALRECETVVRVARDASPKVRTRYLRRMNDPGIDLVAREILTEIRKLRSRRRKPRLTTEEVGEMLKCGGKAAQELHKSFENQFTLSASKCVLHLEAMGFKDGGVKP